MEQYYLLALYDDGTTTVIGLEPKTLSKVQESKSWQLQGFPDGKYLIVTRYAADCFQCIKSKDKFRATRGAYTTKAWHRFLSEWEPNPLLNDGSQ